jgi:hypothetical protein
MYFTDPAVEFELELTELVEYLKMRRIFPEYIQYSFCGDLVFSNVSNEPFETQPLMNFNSCTGMSDNQYHALTIALTEYVERIVCRNNPNLPFANEGVAGRSIYSLCDADGLKAQISQASLNEAIERYAWSKWWDEKSIKSTAENLDKTLLKGSLYHSLCEHVQKLHPGGEFLIVKPNIDCSDTRIGERELLILLYVLNGDAGIISGGNCDFKSNRIKSIGKALGELSRHANAIYRSQQKSSLTAKHFYDQRLLYFASKEGCQVAFERLGIAGQNKVKFPDFEHNRILSHQYEAGILLHQTQFIDHQLFLSGPLERLCL